MSAEGASAKRSLEHYESKVNAATPGLVQECRKRGQVCVSFKVEFTSALPEKASPKEVRQFDEQAKAFFLGAQRRLGVGAEGSGAVVATYVEGRTIRAVALYVGPPLPEDSVRHWKEIAGPGSRITVEPERSTARALREVLRAPELEPAKGADLESACAGVRRIHTLGGFYAVKDSTTKEESRCPYCGAELLNVYMWQPLTELEASCLGDLRKIQRQLQSGQPPGMAA